MKKGWVYILKCGNNSLYTGSTSNLEKRIYEHQNNIVSCYTNNKHPLTLVFSQEFASISEAIFAERQIKKWTKKKKLALIQNDFDLLHELSRCKNETNSENF